jgi:pimeloyl-ACP methyl ester carboxylesterase
MPRLNHIVLIHGASHGGYCWDDVAPLLRKMGYRVSAPDLPGLGADRTPIAGITFEAYVERAVEAVKAANEPVLLLGHSMGGAVVAGTAEAIHEKIGKLVFLAGLVPLDGQSMEDATREFFPAFPPAAPNGMLDFDPATSGMMFYNTCSAETRERAVARLRPQAHAPYTSRLQLTAPRFGEVPKTYIVCTQDAAMPVAAQEKICLRIPGLKRREIDTDHSPFYCDPAGLAAIIDNEAHC